MTVLSAQALDALFPHPITPWRERTSAHGMTYGLGPAGYDIRLKEWTPLDAGGFTLGSSIEHFEMPDNLIAFVKDKSTNARRGLSVFNTVIEPGWKGHLTLELVNHAHRPLVLREGTPIAQIVFYQLDEPTKSPYSGKYQDQRSGPVPARFDVCGDSGDSGDQLQLPFT